MGGIVKPEEFDCASSLWPFFPPRGRPKLTCTFPFRLGLDTDFHELVITQEIVLCGARGYGDGLGGGNVIGLPPVLNFASPELKAKVVPEVFSGKKKICLAISEAFAGSDVSNLRCEAKKSEDGKEWIVSFLALCLSPFDNKPDLFFPFSQVSGHKKWITGGAFADYFTVRFNRSNVFSISFAKG